VNWLDHQDNIKHACEACNGSHAGQAHGLPVLSGTPGEIEFCRTRGIAPRSKDAQAKRSREARICQG
jgi:hypothetical protein